VLVGVVVDVEDAEVVVFDKVVVTQGLRLHGRWDAIRSLSRMRSTAKPERRNARTEMPRREPSRRPVYVTLTARQPPIARTQPRAAPTVRCAATSRNFRQTLWPWPRLRTQAVAS
jgi:hypothetical protein